MSIDLFLDSIRDGNIFYGNKYARQNCHFHVGKEIWRD